MSTSQAQLAVNRAYVKGTQKRMRTMNGRVGGYIGLEQKFADFGTSQVPGIMTTSGLSPESLIKFGTTESICTLVEGSGPSSRDGRTITVTGIGIRAGVSVTGARFGPIRVSYALVMDTQTNGALMDPDEVFSGVSAATGAEALVGSHNPFRKLEHAQRYVILKQGSKTVGKSDWEQVPSNDAVVDPGAYTTFDMDWSGRVGVRYNAATGTIGSITDNSFHLLVWCSQAPADRGITVYANSRIAFHNNQ